MIQTTSGLAALAALAVLSGACAGHQAESMPPLPDPLLGRWSLRYDPPPEGRLGTTLTIAIDSVAADSVFGTVENMFSGNVGVDPAVFATVRGTRVDSTVTLLAPPAEGQRLSLEFVGTVGIDTIWISSLRMSGEEMTGSRARVLLIREPGAGRARLPPPASLTLPAASGSRRSL